MGRVSFAGGVVVGGCRGTKPATNSTDTNAWSAVASAPRLSEEGATAHALETHDAQRGRDEMCTVDDFGVSDVLKAADAVSCRCGDEGCALPRATAESVVRWQAESPEAEVKQVEPDA